MLQILSPSSAKTRHTNTPAKNQAVRHNDTFSTLREIIKGLENKTTGTATINIVQEYFDLGNLSATTPFLTRYVDSPGEDLRRKGYIGRLHDCGTHYHQLDRVS